MEGPDRATWFAGDLGDPWVVAIAGALPRETLRIDCPGDLPDPWPVDGPLPQVLVLHRNHLTPTDAQRLTRLRSRSEPSPRVVLCLGPQARYPEVERWSRLVDVILPEATARETVLRHALATERPSRLIRPRIVIVSSNHEFRSTLIDASRLGGFDPEGVSEPIKAPPGVARVWDVPVLDPDWPARLEELARSGPVVALLGFADRASVTLARDHGASACLDLPCEGDDLLSVLDRVAWARHDPPHALPPPPASSRTSRARQARGGTGLR